MLRSRLVNLAVAIVVGVVFLAGLLISGALGAVLLLAVAAFLVVLSASAWHAIPSRGRGVRVIVVALVLVIALLKLAG
jgi:hypothetical protein